MNKLREERDMWHVLHPLVCDFHDETVWECKDDNVHDSIKLMEDVWIEVNKELGGIIPLAGQPIVVESFASFKCK